MLQKYIKIDTLMQIMLNLKFLIIQILSAQERLFVSELNQYSNISIIFTRADLISGYFQTKFPYQIDKLNIDTDKVIPNSAQRGVPTSCMIYPRSLYSLGLVIGCRFQ